MNKKSLAILAGGLVTVSALGAVVCSTVTLYMSTQLNNRISNIQNEVTALSNAYIKEETTDTDPQYVTIANQYEIRDTSAISDAYLSGDSSKLSDEDKETLQLASDVLNEITTTEMTLYDKEVAVHDWMIKNITYNNNTLASIPTPSSSSHTPHGVLKYKKSVCVGYATTFKLFMNMLGADCMVVHDTDLTHSWDIVKLDDNQWYLVDITFDDINDQTNSNAISYSNFNQTSDVFSSTHTWNTELYPTANGKLYNYAALNAITIKDVTKLPKLIKTAMDDKKLSLYYSLPADVDTDYMAAMLTGIEDRTSDTVGFDFNYSFSSNNDLILSIIITYYDNSDTPDENYSDLIQSLDDIFGTANIY